MKKVFSIILIILMVASLAGCSKEASSQKTEEESSMENKAELEAEAQKDAETKGDNQTDSSKTETKTDKSDTSGNDTASKPADDGRIEVATYAGGNGFKLLIEEDKSKEVVKGIPVNYLSMKYTNGQKKLLAQSVDRGEDWTDSIATLHYPTLSIDGTKVYYSTDNTFTRSSGYGANNYRTRVVDLKTFGDSYFEEGALVTILNSGPYANHVVLELNSLDSAGNPTMVYQVVTPSRDQLVVLENAGNWQSQIEAKLNGGNNSRQNQPQQNTPSSNQAPTKTSVELIITEIPFNGVKKSSLVESIHGYSVEYNRYYSVIIPNYPLKVDILLNMA